jgi:hypothetical protein
VDYNAGRQGHPIPWRDRPQVRLGFQRALLGHKRSTRASCCADAPCTSRYQPGAPRLPPGIETVPSTLDLDNDLFVPQQEIHSGAPANVGRVFSASGVFPGSTPGYSPGAARLEVAQPSPQASEPLSGAQLSCGCICLPDAPCSMVPELAALALKQGVICGLEGSGGRP